MIHGLDTSPFTISVYFAKTAIVLIWVTGLYRLLGKRFVGQLNVYDLVTVAAVSNAVQNAMTEGSGELMVGLVSAATLIGVGWFATRVYLKSPKLEGLVNGIPTLLVYQGSPFPDRMKREHVSMDEIRAALNAHGMDSLKEVGMAVLEADGSISIVPADRSCKFES